MGKQSTLEKLKDGIRKFQIEVHAKKAEHYERVASTPQTPHTLIIACADSRVDVEAITSSGPGAIFVTRNVGNMVPPYSGTPGGVTAVIEYAVAALNVKHLVVCGHSDCGAMKALLHPHQIADKPSVAAWLKHADTARHVLRCHDHGEADALPLLIEENVVAQLDHLRTLPMVAARLITGALQIHGWVYDIAQAGLHVFDPGPRAFVPLDDPAKYGPSVGAARATDPVIA